MIPKEAFAAIAAVMAVSCAFGYVPRGELSITPEKRNLSGLRTV